MKRTSFFGIEAALAACVLALLLVEAGFVSVFAQTTFTNVAKEAGVDEFFQSVAVV